MCCVCVRARAPAYIEIYIKHTPLDVSSTVIELPAPQLVGFPGDKNFSRSSMDKKAGKLWTKLTNS